MKWRTGQIVYRQADGELSEAEVMSNATGLECKDPSKAVQSEKEEADINTIVRRFGIGQVVPQNVRAPLVGDFTGLFDFQSAMNAIVEAERSFMAMPADVRKRFGNNPQEFVLFCSDEKNLDEMRKMGLAVPKKEPVAAPAPVPASA